LRLLAAFDLANDRGVESYAAVRHEVPPVDPPEGDAARSDLRLDALKEQAGRLDGVFGDTERARENVGEPSRQDAERRLGSREPVRHLVHGAVSTERYH